MRTVGLGAERTGGREEELGGDEKQQQRRQSREYLAHGWFLLVVLPDGRTGNGLGDRTLLTRSDETAAWHVRPKPLTET
ncbi:hypothetical protein Pen01_30730 [Phytomonospora endophytica]|nr:hypothetical protein Pen01_30730 [Phytomonospora endophytica]